MSAAPEEDSLYRGRYLALQRTAQGWEYVTRTNARACIAILAVTDDDRIILTEQYRPPVGRAVIELPAGLVGDEPGQGDEPLLEAAQRELLEETGFEATHWMPLLEGVSSAGLSDEGVVLFQATGLRKVAEGGGVGGESIQVHLVPRRESLDWCRARQAEGKAVDFKIFAAIHLTEAGR